MCTSTLGTAAFAEDDTGSTLHGGGLAVFDATGTYVEVGTDVDVLDTLLGAIGNGQMNANKFGAFEDEEDAANGVVKLTFDVVGKPVVKEEPVDVLIIADESGSMNMYGGAETYAKNVSYMACLNESHAYKVTGLQKKLNEKAGVSGGDVTANDDVVYINPHVAGLECIVISQWGNAENAEALINMVEKAGIKVPEGMTGTDVFNAMHDIKWCPDSNHGYFEGKTFVEIPYVENSKTIAETGKQFSY